MTGKPPAPPSSPAAGLSRAPREEEDAWVTVVSCGDAAAAEVARGVIEQAELPVRLVHVHTASMLAGASSALGGVGVQVRARDARMVRFLLAQSSRQPGMPVFRVRSRAEVSTAAIAALASSVAAGVLARLHLIASTWISTVIVVGAIAGLAAGRLRVAHHCSNVRCGARIPDGAAECPGCGGKVEGVIASLDQRLAAEEALGRGDGDPTT